MNAFDVLDGKEEFIMIDEKALTKTKCVFIEWSHNNKRAIVKNLDLNKNMSIDGEEFLEFIGWQQ